LVINLWGMTGVGKTDVIRHLVKLLNFQDRFLEVELSNSDGGSYRYLSSLSKVLELNKIDPGKPNIILFDEIQKFRTIDEDGKELKELKFQDFWELLSDGKLSKKDKSSLIDLWEKLEFKAILEKNEKELAKENEGKNKSLDSSLKTMQIGDRYDGSDLKEHLKTDKSFMELAGLETQKALEMVRQAINSQSAFEASNYNQSLIIICGNIDEAYTFAGMTSEAEIDPDIFYSLTKKINIVDIKHALSKRFRPEQVSRFGNIHILYPSLSKISFEKLIALKIQEMVSRIYKKYKIKVVADISINQIIYDNGVFPVQGVRPVFSTISDIFEKYLVKFLFDALSFGFESFSLSYDTKEKCIIGNFSQGKIEKIKYVGRVDKVRQSSSADLVSLVSVHEAGHALIYSLEFGLAPLQLKSRVASVFSEGFTFPHHINLTKGLILSKINTLLAGKAAEEEIFGTKNVSVGCAGDLLEATKLAAEYVRKYGFSNSFKAVVSLVDNGEKTNSDLSKTNKTLNKLIQVQENIVKKILINNRKFLLSLAKELKGKGDISPVQFQQIAKSNGVKCLVKNENFTIIPKYEKTLNSTEI